MSLTKLTSLPFQGKIWAGRSKVARQTGKHASAAYEEGGGAVPIASRLVVVASCIAAITATAYGLWGPEQPLGVAEVDEVDALDNPAILKVQTGDDSSSCHVLSPSL